MKKVYVTLLFLVISMSNPNNAAKIKKKFLKEAPIETATPQPAIIAIEIVDPNENSTSKNSKRTIDNALGYGYNSFDKPRYEVYKYSQHDIPGFKGDSRKLYKHPSSGPSIQKSVQYTLPTITEYTQSPLKPGTTLYSSLTSKGQVGGLRSSLAQIPELQHNSNPVPVILLRIYPDQLQDSTIHANLPDGHPFAKVINSVNIQSLLNHYVKALKVTASQSGQAYSSVGHQQKAYQNPIRYHYQTSTVQPQYPEEIGYYQQQQQQQYQDYGNGIQVQETPIKYHYQYQANHQVSTQTPQPQYYYVPASASQTTDQQYYQQPSQDPQEQAYYEPQYQNYYPSQQQQKLLTEENYPSNKHTRVIFKTPSGGIRTPESEESSRTTDVKTIKIHVPENVAKVEVQESERPYYGYQQEPENQEYSNTSPTQSEVYVTPKAQEQEDYYNTKQDYYNTQERPGYDLQNLGYDEMVKYLSRRGALNNYYFHQGVKESEDVDQKSNDQMVAAYEEGFPSSTGSPRPRKVKTKKRS